MIPAANAWAFVDKKTGPAEIGQPCSDAVSCCLLGCGCRCNLVVVVMRPNSSPGLGFHGVFVNGTRVFDGKDYVKHAKGPGKLLDKFLPAGPNALAAAAQ